MMLARVLFLLAAGAQSAFGADPSTRQPPAQAPATPVATAAAATPTLERLFFSAGERAALDDARRRPAPAVAASAEKSLPPAPEYVTLNGVVRRSDGSTAVWLNNRMIEGKRTYDGLEVTDSKRTPGPANVTVKVPQSGRSVDLRVGQELDVTSGKVQERYRLAPPAAAAPSGETGTPPTTAKSSPVRRPSRERDLRDLEAPQAEPPRPPVEAKG